MAAVAGVQTVNITVNGIDLQVPKGEMIVESVKRLGIDIPIFCYHPRLKPVGMCRMCLVEVGMKGPDGSVRKMPKPQTACSLPASEGLVIDTDTPLIHNDRRGVLEFLLINHPLDCPVCDRGGECPLQNNTLFYGPSTSRFIEMKRHAPKAFPLSKYVTLDLERCIQCGRCVRFTEEISGDHQLAFRHRGASMQPSTFGMTEFESKFSGNVIEICPVGALTNAKYRFRARPWDLQTRPGICTICSNGCNVHVDYRKGDIVRINGRTNEEVNEEWTCDRGKFGHYVFNTDERLTVPLVRQGDALVQTEWAAVYREILGAFGAKSGVAALGGANNSNEDLFLLQRLFRRDFVSDNLDHRFEKNLTAPDTSIEAKLGVSTVQNAIADFETAATMLVFGTSLADEEPILFLRVRKAWFQNGAKVVVAHSAPTDADSFAHLVLRYTPGTEETLAEGLIAAIVRTGKAQVPPALVERLAAFTPEYVSEVTGVSAEALAEAADILSANAAIITIRGLYDTPRGASVVETLASLAMVTGGTFNNYARKANEEGAKLIGIQPAHGGINTHGILRGCASGEIKALWLVGCDPFAEHPDLDLVQKALENVEFLVVQDWRRTEATSYASVVLPMTAPMEMDGSYTNIERRVQVMRQVFPPRGEAKPAGRVFAELSLRLRPEAPLFNRAEVFARLATEIPAFADAVETELDGSGHRLGAGTTPGFLADKAQG